MKTSIRAVIVAVLMLLMIRSGRSQAANPLAGRSYVGSKACQSCHADVYARWQKTPMANVVRDPREHPDAIIPDLSKPDPLVKFTKDDVGLVYGSIWKHAISRRSATTTIQSRHSETSRTRFGALILSPPPWRVE